MYVIYVGLDEGAIIWPKVDVFDFKTIVPSIADLFPFMLVIFSFVNSVM